MSTQPDKRKVARILAKLEEAYPDVTCALDHRSPYELLAATILSAQCTDERVNMVTPALFERYPTPEALAHADQAEVEELVRSTGFYRNKAKSLVGMARTLVADHGGEVPQGLEALVKLPGVARKTANVLMGTAFRIASGVVVDTHVMRIARLLGFTEESDAVKVERDLMALLPEDAWIDFSHRIIHHGRQVCIARRPACDRCTMNRLCPSAFDEVATSATKADARKASGKKKTKKKKAAKKSRTRAAR